MKIYEMSGSEYEIGFQIGQLLKSAMKDCVVETTELLKKQEKQKDFQEVKFKIEKRYPEYLQHL